MEPIISIGDLYPNLTETELAEAEKKIEDYLKLVLRIYERLEAEGKISEVLDQIRVSKHQ